MGKTILLIVEDDSAHLHALDLVLQKHDFQIIKAMDGEEALQKLSSTVPDLVILDLMLPKMSGVDVLEAMRKYERLKSVPVIVCTVLYDEDMKTRCEALGISGFYKKTQCSLDEIDSKIQDILKKTSKA